MFHVAKVATVLARCDFQGALKNIAHRVDVSEAALARDRFHAVRTFFKPAPRSFYSQPFDKFCGRRLHFFRKDAREIARTHGHALRQRRDRERLVQIIEHPRFELAQRLAIRRL